MIFVRDVVPEISGTKKDLINIPFILPGSVKRAAIICCMKKGKHRQNAKTAA